VLSRIQQGQAKRFSMQEAECHNAIARSSLKYLTQFQQPLSNRALKAFALAKYAAKFWSSYLLKTGDDIEELSWLAAELLSIGKPTYYTWIQLHNLDPKRVMSWREPKNGMARPLYYAALLGLGIVARMLLNKGADVNAQGGYYGNALQAALYRGHEQVVKMLLNKGADVNAQGGHYGNALQAASARGHEQVVKMLLDKGANVNAQSRYYSNALQAASARGYEQVVKMLLNKGANVNAQGGHYNNALQVALA
jgi:hypothetical protein